MVTRRRETIVADGQGRGYDGYAEAPAPALQRAIGRTPALSAVVLIALYIAIGVRTGISGYYFPRIGDVVRLGILLVWLGLMTMVAIMFWTLWIASRLRWFHVQFLSIGVTEETPETVRLLRSGERLAMVSRRVRPWVTWLVRLGAAAAIAGLGLLAIGL